MKKIIISLLCCIYLIKTQAQQNDTAVLQEVTISAYEYNNTNTKVPVAISIVGKTQLQRSTNTSLVNTINVLPGIRMEERSPGSYRLNIRGSSLRSPFGVRNVKMYWNGLPFTDAGGNTYLNQFSFYDIEKLEIIKGPGSSLYGAGTGGVLLAKSINYNNERYAAAAYTTGSFGLHNLHMAMVAGNDSFMNKLQCNYAEQDGYRQQSAMRRTTASWETTIKPNAVYALQTHFLYGDLFYETPGGLNKTQFTTNPRAARPAAGPFPSAIDNKAAIYQKTIWAGIQQNWKLHNNWQNVTGVYGAFSQIKNPAIRNYEKRNEPNAGGRSVFNYTKKINATQFKFTAGTEMQYGFYTVTIYNNKKGLPDTLQTADEVNNALLNIFSQAVVSIADKWNFTAGISLNKQRTKITRTSMVPNYNFSSNYTRQWMPRFAVMRWLGKQFSLYATVAKGFSPPSVAELLPSTTIINTSLQAEYGWNYEMGARLFALKNRLQVELNAYQFNLKNAIVQRRDAGGADYFINAGGTTQKGVELTTAYNVLQKRHQFFSYLTLWGNYTYAHYRYNNFKQLINNFDGKQLPGIAPHVINAGIDIDTKAGLYAHIIYTYSNTLALNDANTEKAASFNILNAKFGYKTMLLKKCSIDFFAGADNIFNTTYSLGNDINAAAGRYYNAAPGINYYAGVAVRYVNKK
jgi:iron complex outermembrane recepter protein